MNYSVVCIQIGTDGVVLRSGETDFSVKPKDASVFFVCLAKKKYLSGLKSNYQH